MRPDQSWVAQYCQVGSQRRVPGCYAIKVFGDNAEADDDRDNAYE